MIDPCWYYMFLGWLWCSGVNWSGDAVVSSVPRGVMSIWLGYSSVCVCAKWGLPFGISRDESRGVSAQSSLPAVCCIWIWLPCDCFTTGKKRHCCCSCPLSAWLCVCVILFHSLWHSSCQCGHRNQSVLRWPHSPPRWRRGLRCVVGRMPPWGETGRVEKETKSLLTEMQQTQNVHKHHGGKNICWVLCRIPATVQFKAETTSWVTDELIFQK